jgi:hypothetical protein
VSDLGALLKAMASQADSSVNRRAFLWKVGAAGLAASVLPGISWNPRVAYAAGFFDDPIKTAEKNSIRPDAGEVQPSALDEIDGSLDLYEVKAADAIRYGSVAAGRLDNELKVTTAASGGGTPLYYLPWGPNQAYRMTLTPPEGATEDPDFFLTAEVNGCSIFIDGPPTAPTVYHLNARDEAGSLADHNMRDGAKGLKKTVKKKISKMEKTFKKARKKHPAMGGNADAARTVNMNHYLKPLLDADAFDQFVNQLRQEFPIAVDAPPIMRKNGKGVLMRPADPIIDGKAAVFGIRHKKKKTWSFYVAPSFRIAYQILKDGEDGTSTGHWELSSFHVRGTSCWGVYPKGVGDNIK